MATTIKATESLKKVQEAAERIKSDAPQRFPEAASPGDFWRQGDIYITLLDGVPEGCQRVEQPQRQLAPGHTRGSRHVLDSLKGVALYQRANADALDGPVIRCDVERTVTHPGHGDVTLPPGVYGITYQRAYAEELRRQMD